MQIPIEKNMSRLSIKKKLCPVLSSPFEDCYCNKMSSQDIERAIYLCTSHFERCDVYNIRERKVKSG
jgi:hypothetical protein